jgi:hypothetical protein
MINYKKAIPDIEYASVDEISYKKRHKYLVLFVETVGG